ncbi:phosphatidylinositol 3,4,5-trisphosphate 3-phosphatase and protein-tyrosine-phosphatase PTEN2A [Malania oleifera]|uniref:phosphatidylinositol 3,4,5-trisphosphate 3-phosphatase and protein-tyrosine-phosphatase PTEN2A n=1 Tax=Malania oleifera TaxID=397392 RepID=UPI0025AE3634|nr:phosphatidylinositol 3,4,5-trisphosphate 3-phosphatase and protein-tyrosine-phosphatase PTEN2A [Malania oleifera]XP_057963684.1 phosphatidylinositol 3,4,5-trisphosphate 3-phosphatase and protein-tyrosine-phosphatase PTEN2A [Malania oleifera]
MDSEASNSSTSPSAKAPDVQPTAPTDSGSDKPAPDGPSRISPSGISSWAKNLKIPPSLTVAQDDAGNAGKSTFARFTSGLGLRLSPKAPLPDDSSEEATTAAQPGFIGTLTKGLVDSSKNAVKAVQVKARHVVSQNKRRYQLASFPFDDHNCPPIQLIISFCQSAYSWLKEDIENVVVVHCKAGMARTGLMISSLLLFLKFFPTAEESIDYYNQKRCVDGKGLVLPSQIRYVKYFERTLTYFNGESQPGRRCMLRGFRLHRCPYWIRPSITISDHNGVLFSTKKHPRTKDLTPEDYWFSAPKKGIMVFAMPGEPGLTELAGDFKIYFHDRHGDFYFWLNTTMMENRKILNTDDLDGFDKRKLPSPGFQVEVVLVDYDGTNSVRSKTETAAKKSEGGSGTNPAPTDGSTTTTAPCSNKDAESQDKDDVFSDSEGEEAGSSKSRQARSTSAVGGTATTATSGSETSSKSDQTSNLTRKTEQMTLENPASNAASEAKSDAVGSAASSLEVPSSGRESDFKAMAADASVFTFGDEDDYESE